MPGLRFAYLLALAVWLGGLLVLSGVAAPIVFDVLQVRVPGQGRVLAGAVFGATLARFHLVSYACGAVMLVSLLVMALIGPRPRPFAPRLAAIGLMLAMTAVVAFPVTWRMQAVQSTVDGPLANLATDDPRKHNFDRLHRLSELLLGGCIACGVALFFWEARDRRA